MEQDLTQGSISKVLLRFVLPFLGASILQFVRGYRDRMEDCHVPDGLQHRRSSGRDSCS